MRKIPAKSWEIKVPIIKDGKETNQTETRSESLLTALNMLLSGMKPSDVPRGLDQFRTYGRLSKAFDKAEKTEVLELEETDYKFLKDMIDKDVPCVWGANPKISEAIESFLEAKSEEGKE